MLVVPSASLAEAVIPTREPLAEFSARLLAAGLLSVTGGDVELIDIGQVDREVLGREAAVGAGCPDGDAVGGGGFELSSVPSATLTTPVLALIAKRPPALLSSE